MMGILQDIDIFLHQMVKRLYPSKVQRMQKIHALRASTAIHTKTDAKKS